MRLTTQAIQQGFKAHGRVYASQREWMIGDHVTCWVHAEAAFDRESYQDFEWLHVELKSRWQVFRSPSGVAPTPAETWAIVKTLDGAWRGRRLHDLTDTNIGECWDLINSVSGIKVMKSAPSVVAISKFLHFWNPRLFVIVDDAVMWIRVFSRSWLRAPIETERKRLEAVLPGATCSRSESCELLDYLAILSWSARFLRLNHEIPRLFGEYVRDAAKEDAASLALDEYEGAAVEWLLLGLAELPPPGVDLE
jgi:hypothetical protein